MQSGYLPWKGQFDLMHDVDLFIFLDDVQFTLRDWRTRNRIKTPQGLHWLTVPVGSHRELTIDQVSLPSATWQARHWKTLCHAYGRAPHFARYREVFEAFYLGQTWTSLSAMNQHLTRVIAGDLLGLRTRFLDARPFGTAGRKTPKLLQLLQAVGAEVYFTGPSTRSYLDTDLLAAHGIRTVFKDFSGFPAYPQPPDPFDHGVSVLDLLFRVGPEAPEYIWGWRSHREAT